MRRDFGSMEVSGISIRTAIPGVSGSCAAGNFGKLQQIHVQLVDESSGRSGVIGNAASCCYDAMIRNKNENDLVRCSWSMAARGNSFRDLGYAQLIPQNLFNH